MREDLAIYIHIPFCFSKCSYCDFCSFVPSEDDFSRYKTALFNEIDSYADLIKNRNITTLYIGGGTPSILPDGMLLSIVDKIKSLCSVELDSITIEANPNSFTLKKAQEFQHAGCNRISFGLQSASSHILKTLNRAHNYEDFLRAIKYASDVGIRDINVDVMLGVPEQTFSDIEDTLNKVVALPVTHISAYGLICEAGTPLTRKIEAGELSLPSEDDAVKMYDYAVEFLSRHGFNRYEISNFSKPGFESKHNLNYWARGEYLGLGLSAHSFVNGVRYCNTSNFAKYLKGDIIEDRERETLTTAKQETIMLALRTTQGLDILAYNHRFKTDFCREYKQVLDKLIKNNLVTLQDNFLRITPQNFYISSAIIAEFF